MADEIIKKGTGDGGIEFNPPVPEIYGDGKMPTPPLGGALDSAAVDTTAEDVGLKLDPATRLPPDSIPNFKRILNDVKLPERRVQSAEPLSPDTPMRSAPPVGQNSPDLSPLPEKPGS